jgi:hypothetical protein
LHQRYFTISRGKVWQVQEGFLESILSGQEDRKMRVAAFKAASARNPHCNPHVSHIGPFSGSTYLHGLHTQVNRNHAQ